MKNSISDLETSTLGELVEEVSKRCSAVVVIAAVPAQSHTECDEGTFRYWAEGPWTHCIGLTERLNAIWTAMMNKRDHDNMSEEDKKEP